MCGILGVSGPFNPLNFAFALSKIKHRGPDDSDIFLDEGNHVALGHVRLSILDLSILGHQPMFSEDGRVVLIFNGEIYNFQELRSSLEDLGHVFTGHSDTEVLLRLYLEFRTKDADLTTMLSSLNGVFAFAIWDADKKSILLVRDALGVKPLYYSLSNGRFIFASEIKALLHLAPEMRELDVASLHRYLSFLWCPGEGTPLKGVYKLGPGEALWVRDGVIERSCVWYKLPIFRGVASADLNEHDSIAGTESHLRKAVQRQMLADVPVGAFLSGGLDSSAIVAFAREKNPQINCFTIDSVGGQEQGVTEDLPFARRVSKYLGVPLEVVTVDHKHIADDIEFMVGQLDEPIADPASLNVYYISQLARKQGIKVLLSGAGGDDLFTGYRRHRALLAEAYWTWLPHGARRCLEQITASLDQRSVFSRRLGKLFSGAGLDGSERLANYFCWTKETELLALYTPETRKALGIQLAAKPMIDFLEPLPNSTKPLDRMLALEQRFFLTDHNLNYTDKMSMAVGIEVRVPFLDLDLIDFAARIPMQYKQHGTESKWVLKKAMESYLPKDVIYRPKTGFGVPLRQWMRYGLRDLLGDVLSSESLKHRGLFDPVAVQKLIAANDLGKTDASYTLLSLMCIEIWCRKFIDELVLVR
jgi:asparagine synthase (glutamine-hydrolysing)